MVLDVRGISTITDMIVVVTGTSPPHLRALLDEIDQALKLGGQRSYHRSGTADSGWMVLDYVDVVVHIMSPEARTYYDLERLWSDGRTWEPASGSDDPVTAPEEEPDPPAPPAADPQ